MAGQRVVNAAQTASPLPTTLCAKILQYAGIVHSV
jgi:hypothetical protein